MKKTLLLFVLLCSLLSAKASDTLTIRQVYNFDVGDTFIYRYSYSESTDYGSLSGSYTFKKIITSKSVSLNADTITYKSLLIYPTYVTTDSVSYFNLDSSIYMEAAGLPNVFNIKLDTIRLSDGRKIDSLSYTLSNGQQVSEYGEGIGKNYADQTLYEGPLEDGDAYIIVERSTGLVYFSKLQDTWGDYPAAVSPDTLHYTPIPEDSAFWNYNTDAGYSQLHTGHKIQYNNHVYVGLLYRSLTFGPSASISDSLIGYFRNDTIGRKVYFMNLSYSELLLYDFTRTAYVSIDAPLYQTLAVHQQNIGGVLREVWFWNAADPFGAFYSISTVEGVGSTRGLFPYPDECVAQDEYFGPVSHCGPLLTSFCVYGHTVYPDTVSTCSLLTGIPDVGAEASGIYLYPNPAFDVIYLSCPGVRQQNAHFLIVNLLGQAVYSLPVSDIETTYDISKLPSGIYTWHLQTEQGIIRTGKIVKQ